VLSCGGDKGDGPSAEQTTSVTTEQAGGGGTETADTGRSARGWRPDGFTVYSQFATDDGRLRTWRLDGVEYAPFVALELWEDSSDASANICTVFLVIDDPVAVELDVWSWTDATEEAEGQQLQHLGFLVPSDARVETDGCDDVDVVAFGDPGTTIASKLWGVGVGGLRVDVEARFDDEITEGFWFDAWKNAQLVGGSWSSDVWEPAIWGSHIAVATEIESDGTVLTDDQGQPTPLIDASEVLENPAAIPDAHYALSGILVYDAQAYLY
jgi:hypothetical protein